MLSQSIEKTVMALSEAQRENDVLDLEAQGALIKVMQRWQALAIGLECNAAPKGQANWKPKIVEQQGSDCALKNLTPTEVLENVLS